MSDRLALTPKNSQVLMLQGELGAIECLKIMPSEAGQIKGIALIFHPDPSAGGNNTHKVIQTLARYLSSIGYICYCPNSRGVGQSAGVISKDDGELRDGVKLYEYLAKTHVGLECVLAGFSYGTYIACHVASVVAQYKHLILLGPAVSRYEMHVNHPSKTTVIHGDKDEVIELKAVLEWGAREDVVINVFPNTSHFFHGKLQRLVSVLASYNCV